MLELLEQLFRQVRHYSQTERFDSDRARVYRQSSKHTTMQFDRDAEDIIIEGLIQSGHGFEIVTEERETFSTGDNVQYRIIIDPIDGSTNVARGLMTAAVAMAVLPIEAPVVPEQVEWALVGDLFTGNVYQAQKGRGAFRNGFRCKTSHATGFKHSLIGLNLDRRDEHVRNLLTKAPALGQIRRTGSSAIDCVYVASGTYDAYIDVGDVITGESFLASASIVLEAGGVVSDQHGKPLRPIQNLTEGYSLVVACTKELHEAILTKLL